MEDLYRSTPIHRALAGASVEEMLRVSILFDIAYMLAKEEWLFSKYPSIIEVEKHHGVDVGNRNSYSFHMKNVVMLAKSELLLYEFATTQFLQSKLYPVLCDSNLVGKV